MMKRTAFSDWARASGFHGRALVKAGASVGLRPHQVRTRTQGIVAQSEIELRGLTAAYLGLPPWAPGLADVLDEEARAAVTVARHALARCLARYLVRIAAPPPDTADAPIGATPDTPDATDAPAPARREPAGGLEAALERMRATAPAPAVKPHKRRRRAPK